MNNIQQQKRGIQRWLVLFIIGLMLSGITAFAIETELAWVLSWWPENSSSFHYWLLKCHVAISETNLHYPYIAYGYDWLAFAHLVIAVAFIGPLRDPVRNIWVIEFGMIACGMVFPLAFIAGYIRQIPFYWQLIDCSFGLLGIIPLVICYKRTLQLQKLYSHKNIQA
ncbi:MAG: hypothetical protein KIT80_16370 [Chitinophagaceae bacterium]|nr:hypothetical protein [Chitinophagaceae bacterium]MCW5928493.1 hypothetical protein [Chitinophagaceae bacterium]